MDNTLINYVWCRLWERLDHLHRSCKYFLCHGKYFLATAALSCENSEDNLVLSGQLHINTYLNIFSSINENVAILKVKKKSLEQSLYLDPHQKLMRSILDRNPSSVQDKILCTRPDIPTNQPTNQLNNQQMDMNGKHNLLVGACQERCFCIWAGTLEKYDFMPKGLLWHSIQT